MSEFALYRLALAAGGSLALGAGCLLQFVSPEKLTGLEALPRARKAGFLLGMAALLWCVPLLRPIAFDWMQVFLLPAALILPFVCYHYLDYLFARSSAGIMMLFAGYLVQNAFTFHSSGTPILAVFSWILGIAGILISGKPCWQRDYFRALAARKRVRLLSSLYLVCFGLILLHACLQHFRTGAAS